MKYILDTNICIYIINKKPAKVLRKFEIYPVCEFGISAITHAELRYGVEKSKNRGGDHVEECQPGGPVTHGNGVCG